MVRNANYYLEITVAHNDLSKGLDIANVHRIIEFMVPPSLSVLTQHFGRGGRSGEPTTAILLVETSVYKLQTRKASSKEGESSHNCDEDDANNDDNEDNEDYEDNSNNIEKASYRKKLDENLRTYILASGCRRNISNNYFQNPPRTACEFISLSKCVSIG
jgi:bloom syndrome protein